MSGYKSAGDNCYCILGQRQLPCVPSDDNQTQQDQRDGERRRDCTHPDVGKTSGQYERQTQRTESCQDPWDPTAGYAREHFAHHVPRWQRPAAEDQYGNDGNERYGIGHSRGGDVTRKHGLQNSDGHRNYGGEDEGPHPPRYGSGETGQQQQQGRRH
jgi:hypothetical protein